MENKQLLQYAVDNNFEITVEERVDSTSFIWANNTHCIVADKEEAKELTEILPQPKKKVKKMIKVTDVKNGDQMDFWGMVSTVTKIEISTSGKTIRFKFDDDTYTTWWRIHSEHEILV